MRRLVAFVRSWPIAIMLTAVVVTQTLLIVAGAVVLRDIRDEVVSVASAAEERSVRGSRLVQDVIVCLSAQQHDHRQNTEHAHRLIAGALGVVLDPPAPPSLPDLPSGSVGCEVFINGAP